MRSALLQLNVCDDPAVNLPQTLALLRQAASEGARFILTPECTNALSSNRAFQQSHFAHEAEDRTLAALREEAAKAGIWLLIGSLGLKTHDADGRFANRSFLIDPSGAIQARYDKIHMFDVTVSEQEVFRESAGYRPGTEAVLVETEIGAVGLSICYDLRFPALYRSLAQAGAQILTVPAAFSHTTGPAHWHALLRARAIECGAYVLAPAQTGIHAQSSGSKPRQCYGHSLVIDPWGEIVADQGEAEGVLYADIDLQNVVKARARIPSLSHDRPFTLIRRDAT